MNEMYEYLKDHAYISKNKKSNYQFELSKERAECIANKYDNLIKELQKENQELKKQLEKEEHLVDKAIHVSLKQKSTIENYKYKIDFLKTQQKDFIEWLEDGIRTLEILDETFTLKNYKNEIRIYKEILSKYKEIIGDSNEES